MTAAAAYHTTAELHRIRLGVTEHGSVVELDLTRLYHAFIAGSTRSGKSNTMRVILERARGPILPNGGVVHQAIIDPQGEFASSLTQLGDYIVFSRDGPLRINPESAELLAEQFVEHGFNLIADMSSVPPDEAAEWIANFTNALASLRLDESPRAHGRRALIIYDEVQKYAPSVNKKEKGASYPAARAIINLVATGAKLHVHVIQASQRMAKVNADVRSECSTRLIGKHNEEADCDDGAKQLGMRKSASTIADKIASLKQGWFFARGDAIGDGELVTVHIDKARTDPPEDLTEIARAPMPTSEAARAIARELETLEERAEEEAESLEDAREQIRVLQERLKERPVELVGDDRAKDLEEQLLRLHEQLADAQSDVDQRMEAAVRAAEDHVNAAWAEWASDVQSRVHAARTSLEAVAGQTLSFRRRPDHHSDGLGDNRPDGPPRMPRTEVFLAAGPGALKRPVTGPSQRRLDDAPSEPAAPVAPPKKPADVSKSQQAILDAMSELGALDFDRPSPEMVCGLAGMPYNSTFRNNVSALRGLGLIEPPAGDGALALTREGRAAAATRVKPKKGEVRRRVGAFLSDTQNAILDVLVKHYPNAVEKERVAEAAGVPFNSTFRNNLSRLSTLRIVKYPKPSTVRARDWLFMKEGPR